VIELPDTLVWRQLQRLAALAGVESIALRQSGAPAGPAGVSRYADVTWPGGEVESVRLPSIDDPDDLARALAHELRLSL
jgi:hypothetical protein